MDIWGGARCITRLGISAHGKHSLGDLNFHVSQSSDRLPDRMLWVDGINARRVKKNKDNLQGIIMVGFSPVHGGLHKFDILSLILSTNIDEVPTLCPTLYGCKLEYSGKQNPYWSCHQEHAGYSGWYWKEDVSISTCEED